MSRRSKRTGISAAAFFATFSACGPRDPAPRAVAPVITADTATSTLAQMATELRSRLNDSTRYDDQSDMREQLKAIDTELERRRDAEFAKTVARTR